MTHRLTDWADRNLLPGLVGILLLVDLAVGVNWVFSPVANLTSPIYRFAKLYMPMAGYGLIMIVMVALAGTLLLAFGRCLSAGRVFGLMLGGAWLFWTALFLLVPFGLPNASYFSAIMAAGLAALHMLAGPALARVPADPRRA